MRQRRKPFSKLLRLRRETWARMSMPPGWRNLVFVIRIECSRVAAVAVEVALDALGAVVTRWDEADEDCVRFEEYFCDTAAANARSAQMESILEQWSADARYAIGVTELRDRSCC